MRQLLIIIILITEFISSGCNNKKDNHTEHSTETIAEIYTCPMHPQIQRDQPGKCPICGMQLVKKVRDGKKEKSSALEGLLKPTNEIVISNIAVTTIQKKEEAITIQALGNITYDTRQAGTISSRVAGRIEKLYIHYRYQKINKGQRILDLYSPELMTAQQNLLFLLKNDPDNSSFIQAAKARLQLLGMSDQQIKQIKQSGKPSLTIAVFSNYSGHIHESTGRNIMNTVPEAMTGNSTITEELSLKEGMYLQKGQLIFSVYNPDYAWAILNIYAENQGLVKIGNPVTIIPETSPGSGLQAKIDFIEPFYQKESKTLTARVYFDNTVLKIPIGSQVTATIRANRKDAYWLPAEAVVSLGLDKVAFIKTREGFKAQKINTGTIYNNQVQVLNGINETDSVAVNAQYLMDSESFIKVKN